MKYIITILIHALLSIQVFFPLRGKIDAICILLKKSTKWRHNDIKFRQYVHQSYGSEMLEKMSTLFCAILVPVSCYRRVDLTRVLSKRSQLFRPLSERRSCERLICLTWMYLRVLSALRAKNREWRVSYSGFLVTFGSPWLHWFHSDKKI